MTEILPLYERLSLINNVSDLMLVGSIQAYRPETMRDSSAIVVHDYRGETRRMAA